MIFIAKADGSLSRVIPSAVNQGSVGVNELVLIAPYPKVSSVTAAFILPNGIRTKPNLATLTEIPDVIEGTAYNAWVFELTAAITEYAGNVTVQFYVTSADEKVLATYADTFPVSKGGNPEMPDAPTDDIYNQILTAYSNVDARISTAEGNIVSIRGEIGADYASGTVKGRITTAESGIINNTSEINHTKARVSENERDISDIEDAIGTDDTEETVKGRITKAESDISGIKTDIGTNESEDSIKGRITIAEGDIDSLESKMATAEGDIDSLEGKVGEAQANISTLFSKVGNLVQLKNVTFDASSDILTVVFSTENGGEQKIAVSLADFIDATELSSVIEEEVSKNAKEYVDQASASAISAEASADKAEEYAQEAKESADSAKSAYAEQVADANKAASEAKASQQAAESAKEDAEVQAESATQAAENAQQSATLAQQSASTANSVVSSLAPRVSAAEKRLTNLEKGITPDPFVTDDTVAYRKFVPETALPFAAIERVGGMSYKCKNLANMLDFRKNYGVINADGSLTISVSWDLDCNATYTGKLKSGTYTITNLSEKTMYVMFSSSDYSNSVAVGGKRTFTYDGSSFLRFQFESQSANVRTTYKIMLNEGSTALPYEPYFDGIRHAAGTAIESEGANLFSNKTTYQRVGLTFAFDGSQVSITGTATDTYATIAEYQALPFGIEAGKTYSLSAIGASFQIAMWFYNSSGALLETLVSGQSAKTIPSSVTRASLFFRQATKGETYNENVYIMLNEGNTDLEYAPYFKTTYEIPEAVQALDGYGWGTSANYNNHFAYKDDGSVTWNKLVTRRVYTGTEAWKLYTADGVNQFYLEFSIPSSRDEITTCCSHFESISIADRQSNYGTCYSGQNSLCFNIQDIATIEEWKAKLAEWNAEGNPLTVICALLNPVVTDITDLISPDNFIQVEGGGTLTFVNEYQQAVPSTVLYLTKEETV